MCPTKSHFRHFRLPASSQSGKTKSHCIFGIASAATAIADGDGDGNVNCQCKFPSPTEETRTKLRPSSTRFLGTILSRSVATLALVALVVWLSLLRPTATLALAATEATSTANQNLNQLGIDHNQSHNYVQWTHSRRHAHHNDRRHQTHGRPKQQQQAAISNNQQPARPQDSEMPNQQQHVHNHPSRVSTKTQVAGEQKILKGPMYFTAALNGTSNANHRVNDADAALDNPESGPEFDILRRNQQPNEQLTFRQATGGRSVGAQPAAAASAVVESQWIPIRDEQIQTRQRPPQTPAANPITRLATPKPQATVTTRHRTSQQVNSNRSRQSAQGQRRPQARPSTTPQTMSADGSHHREFYRPPMGHYGASRNQMWAQRRPRLNLAADGDDTGFEFRANKMYKRVLLCDKTLVSLDYVRQLELEPRPHVGGYDGDNFNDNFIDLDSNPEASVGLARRSSTGQPFSTNTSSSSGGMQTAASERRSYLTDEDPLVKCDMWDLEKGIKNRKPPESILRQAIKADFDTVRDAINRCRQLTERTLPAEDEYRDHGMEIMSTEDLVSLFSMKRGLIPGTKWCGLGDQASTYNDLGPKHRIDVCCRAHDHCPIRLKPFRNDYGVLNIALYTKSHCDCDADFYRCLREVRSRTADMLGNLYFNVMKLQCMREERMKICREMKPIALGFERCIRYEESPHKTVFKFTTPPVAY